MSPQCKILFVFGTRPEAIKLAPLVRLLSKNVDLSVRICVTAQHREMLDQVLDFFELVPDYDLDLMQPNQSLAVFSAAALTRLDAVFESCQPDLLFIQGDTSTTLIAAIGAYYRRIPVFHVEAGLRTDDIFSPWPEEGNRRMVSRIAARHFAATEAAKNNLLSEGVPFDKITVSGNTVIDALASVQERFQENPKLVKSMEESFPFVMAERKLILITLHRRENFGDGISNVCQAIRELALSHKDVAFAFPVHPNPNVRAPVNAHLFGIDNVFLLPPLHYHEFVFLMSRSCFILTDSGGIQEEAPFFGKHVFLFRDSTERPEAVEAGFTTLLGTDINNIVDSVNSMLDGMGGARNNLKCNNLFGDGRASIRIAHELLRYLGLAPVEELSHA